MSRRGRWIAALGVVAALVALIVLTGRGPALRKAGAPGGAAATGASAASAAAAPLELAPTDVVRAGRLALVRTLAVSGGLKAVHSAFVKARVAAELKRLEVREGDRVEAGQLIGQLDATEFEWRLRQAEDQGASAQAQLEIAERTLANNQAMVEQGFISRNALATSESNAAAARAALQAARAAAELARKAVRDCEVRAPIGGLVSQRLVQPGERVPLDGRIVEIVDLSRIELEAAVAPDDVPSLRVGQLARVQVDGLAEALAARVARINPSAQSGTRAVLAYLELRPHPGLRQGLFARGTIDLQRKDALAVPVAAVRTDQARPYVLALEQGVAVARIVVPGERGEAVFDAAGPAEPAVEVLDGLAPGAVVLRATVGNLRVGTRLVLAGGARQAAPPASATTPAAAR